MKVLEKLMGKLDRLTPSRLLGISSILCAFVLLAHGGALLAVKLGKAPEIAQDVVVAYFSVPAALVALASSFVAFVRKEKTGAALKVHAVLFSVFAAYMLVFGLGIVVCGAPAATKFAWNPILFAIVLGYPFLLLQRAFPSLASGQSPFRYAPLLAAAFSLLVSAGVFWRTLA